MTLTKLVLWIAFLTCAGLVSAELADSPGHITLVWRDYQIETTVIFMLLIGIAIILITLGIVRIFFWFLSSPRRWTDALSEKRNEQGLQSLTEAFAAMALSDYSFARKQTEKAQKLLKNSPLSLMFAAQLARLEGDEVKTRQYLEQMLADPQTEFVATRGLVETYRKRGDYSKASEQAEKALKLRPQDKWVATTLIDLYSHQRRWQEALQIVEKSYKKKVISSAEYQRFWAIIHYEHGRKLVEAKEWHNASTFLAQAHKKQPDFVPAATLLAKTYFHEGKAEAGFKVLQQSWKQSPHPELAATLHLLFADEVAPKRLKRVEKLIQSQPEHIESLIAHADAALQAAELTKAKHLLTLAYAREESVRVCRLMAELCQRDASLSHEASIWLLRAGTASADPQWTCGACGFISPHWDSHCPSCSNFDSFTWIQRNLRFAEIP